MTGCKPIVLGSSSAIRAEILRRAGLDFTIEPPRVDEVALKRSMEGQRADDVAGALAAAKALEVSRRCPGVVIGADQVLELDGAILDKVRARAEALARLERMSGRAHALVGGIAVAEGGRLIAQEVGRSRLHMRALGRAALATFLDAEGEGVLASVGCYRFEGLGARLFERVEGDYFAILGLPLLPALAMLRAAGALPEEGF